MALIDLSTRLDEPEVRALVGEATGTPASASRAIARYRSREWTLYGWVERGLVVGCIGVEATAPGEVVLHSLAVEPERRRRGIGQTVVREVAGTFAGAVLVAETDSEGVGFYERCGFAVESIGERYPGTERFRCVLDARARAL